MYSTTVYNGVSSKDCYPNLSAGRYTLQECVLDRTAWAGRYEELGGTFEGTGTLNGDDAGLVGAFLVAD